MKTSKKGYPRFNNKRGFSRQSSLGLVLLNDFHVEVSWITINDSLLFSFF